MKVGISFFEANTLHYFSFRRFSPKHRLCTVMSILRKRELDQDNFPGSTKVHMSYGDVADRTSDRFSFKGLQIRQDIRSVRKTLH